MSVGGRRRAKFEKEAQVTTYNQVPSSMPDVREKGFRAAVLLPRGRSRKGRARELLTI